MISKNFIKKIAKFVLLVLMLVGAIITASNFIDSNLHSIGFKVVTYYPDEADCYGFPKDCNDFVDKT